MLKHGGVALGLLSLVVLIVLLPSIKTVVETVVTTVEGITGAFPPFVEMIFKGLPLIILVVGVGSVGWIVLKRHRGGER